MLPREWWKTTVTILQQEMYRGGRIKDKLYLWFTFSLNIYVFFISCLSKHAAMQYLFISSISGATVCECHCFICVFARVPQQTEEADSIHSVKTKSFSRRRETEEVEEIRNGSLLRTVCWINPWIHGNESVPHIMSLHTHTSDTVLLTLFCLDSHCFWRMFFSLSPSNNQVGYSVGSSATLQKLCVIL